MEGKDKLPKRKKIRLEHYDYSSVGAYFITICTKDRRELFWENVGAAISRPEDVVLSPIGKLVEQAILQIADHYEEVEVEKFCIMPDHVHLILLLMEPESGRQVAAPTVSGIIGHMKRWVSKTIGEGIWQKSFVDRIIRNEKAHSAIWDYIHYNPLRPDKADENIMLFIWE